MSSWGLGCATLGNLFHQISDDQATEVVAAAWELGVRHFDTAPHYGLGLSERRLGAALRQLHSSTPVHSSTAVPSTPVPKTTGPAVISTKVGRILEINPDYLPGQLDDDIHIVPATHRRRWEVSREGLRRSLADSLDRLGLDRVDTVLLHDPDQHDFDQALTVGLPALEDLRAAGLVSKIGVGSNDDEALNRCLDAADLDVVMCAGRYTLLDQRADRSLLERCRTRGVDYIAAGVYNSGALATEQIPDRIVYDYREAPEQIRERLMRLHQVCAGRGVSVPHAAVQFAVRHPAVSLVVIGAQTPREVRLADQYASQALPEQFWEDLARAGLIGAP